jgi:hypothetical protein
MKKITLSLLGFCCAMQLFSQAPNALNFDGIDDIVRVNANVSPGNINSVTQARTIQLYFQTFDLANSNRQVLWEEGGENNGFNVFTQNGELYVGAYRDVPSGVQRSQWFKIPIAGPGWHQLNFMFDGSSPNPINAFLDAVPILIPVANTGVGLFNSIPQHPDPDGIGGINNNTVLPIGGTATSVFGGVAPFRGTIDELRIWNRALPLAEALSNMKCELSLPQNGLIAYYQFNEGIAGGPNPGITVLPDVSLSGNNGALLNFALNGPISNWVKGYFPDSDGDGVIDCRDNCPTVANTNQADADSDGIGDPCDACPLDAANDADGDGICGNVDNCPAVGNPNQSDNDQDGIGDACDPDIDGDGILNAADNCPFKSNPGQENNDGDPLGDICDDDDDNDGVSDFNDNCPFKFNPGQQNNDGDALGDICDPDDDNDGIPDGTDNCPLTANADQKDTDGDGTGDACDPDIDGDGILNAADNCPVKYNPGQENNDGDALGDACDPDDDNDGIPDANDNCPFKYNPDQANNDSDALGDACDPDDDNDGVLDGTDNCPLTANANQKDTDGDGLGDACDGDDDGDGVPDAYDCASTDKKNDKWMVCHNGKTLCIAQPAVAAHLAHGDQLGACVTARSGKPELVEVKPMELMSAVYPNPSSGKFDVQVNSRKKAEIIILNANGKVIEQRTLAAEAANLPVRFNIGKLSAGIYLVKIITDGGVQTQKLVIQK